jgi:hypothetical protein
MAGIHVALLLKETNKALHKTAFRIAWNFRVFDGEIKGLDALPLDERPSVLIVYLAFQVM